MTDQTKAIMSTIVIVACIAVLGALAYAKVDGAATAAFGTIAIVVAWLTRSPDNPSPPAAKMLPLFAAAAVVAELTMGCGAAEKAAASEAESAFREQNRDCKRQYPNLDEQNECREKVAESWGVTYTPRTKDGGK